MKRLILLRHGSSEWPESGHEDSDRPLTKVGCAECLQVAHWLNEHDLAPDHALVSSALRTRQSWELVHDNLERAPSFDVHDDLYLAAPGTLLARISALSDTVECALVLAHNPGIEELARMLAGPSPDDEAIRDLMLGYPAAGLALFTVEGDAWDQLTGATTRLTAFVRPGQPND
ncbi:MAG: histidine phosphatase family protein [Rhodospirillaceae bacterium]|jgi:phosphohistidine phosphatase|nr:histidine phosphatase family protein [Rhodospirillaceae bacterium]MBT6404740.1 histidine phosphatase family protein [Rhodospirillaceae bacterium]MBT6536331.1 histidine phosphatase family protein [Rhodospirillaceae bacterium]